MDTRWQNLPHVHHTFVPTQYPNLETWEAEKARLREQILFAAGLWPLPEKPPLNIKIWNRIERDGYTLEKAYFQSLPGFYVGGTLFRPVDPQPKSHPGIISPHGHARLGRLNESDAASYQARGLTFARMGCTAFMWDMIDYNDSARHLSGAYEDENYGIVHRAHWSHKQDNRMLWNIGILGFQLWNSIRALDFISELPEVDTGRLACTGESGGGTQTYNLYAVDDRVDVAAPVCMVSAYMQGGCVCENTPLLRIDTNNVDIGATFAPKPLLLVNSAQDWTQHTPDVEFPAIKKIYDLYDAAHHVSQVQIDAPHGYNLAMREAVYRWFAQWLDLPLGDDFKEPAYEVEPRENLLAFWDGLPEGALTNHEDLIQQCITASKQTIDAYRPDTAEKLQQNRDLLGRGLRIAIGYDNSPVTYQKENDTSDEGLTSEDGLLIGARRNVRIPLCTFNSNAKTATLLVHPQGINALYSPLVQTLIENNHTVYALDPFGIGQNLGEQNPESPRHTIHFSNTYNRTDDAERIYDITLALRHLASLQHQTINVVGFHIAGLWTLIAAAVSELDATTRFIIDANGFDTHSETDYLAHLPIPGVLKAGGLRNAAALVTPHELQIHNTGDVFDTSWAEAAYALNANAKCIVQSDALKNDALIQSLIS
jgi:dienelactone hydrolase